VGVATHDLQFHSLSLKLNGPNLEVNTNGTDVTFSVGVVGETQEQTGLEQRKIRHQSGKQEA